MLNIKYLLNFNDFKDLDDTALLEIAENSTLNSHSKDERIIAKDTSTITLYLFEGSVELQTTGGVQQSIIADSERAQTPVFYTHALGHYATLHSPL